MNGVAILIAIAGGLFFVAKPVAERLEAMLPTWTTYDDLFQKYGNTFGVPWTWLKAIAIVESNLGKAASVAEGIRDPANADPAGVDDSRSSDGKSWGLMQVTLSTAKGLDASATIAKLNNPDFSVYLASKYLSQLSSHFSKIDARYTEWVIKSYNQGPGNTDKERAGLIGDGYAQGYWEKFQAALERVEGE